MGQGQDRALHQLFYLQLCATRGLTAHFVMRMKDVSSVRPVTGASLVLRVTDMAEGQGLSTPTLVTRWRAVPRTPSSKFYHGYCLSTK